MRKLAYHNAEPLGDLPPDASREEILQEFGRRLQKRLIDKKLSQSDLARQATKRMPTGQWVGRDSISLYVRGSQMPGPARLKAIAEVLECHPSDLKPEGTPGVGGQIELRTLGNGLAWVRVNQACALAVALEVRQTLVAAGVISDSVDEGSNFELRVTGGDQAWLRIQLAAPVQTVFQITSTLAKADGDDARIHEEAPG